MTEQISMEPGLYRVVIAHSEVRESKVSGTPYAAVTAVVIEGERTGAVLHGTYAESPKAQWAWEDAVTDIRDLTVGLKLDARVRVELDLDGRSRLRLGKLAPVEPPRTIHRYGSEYRFVRRIQDA
jgi:hypothetical protein